MSILNKFRLDGRVCFLSGATGHLGPTMAKALGSVGASVLVNARTESAVYELVDEIRKTGGVASAYCFDITDSQATADAVQQIEHDYGRLDVIVNNAHSGRPGTFSEINAADFQEVYEVSVIAAFEFLKTSLSLLKKATGLAGGASVINIASMYGSVSPDPSIYGRSGANNPPSYGAAKAALIQFTRYAACHFAADGIRVNCISPGPFPAEHYLRQDPDFHVRLKSRVPMRRTGVPEELVGPLLFLASDASSYVNGINLPVDGGWTAW